jgi:hypothetical protein
VPKQHATGGKARLSAPLDAGRFNALQGGVFGPLMSPAITLDSKDESSAGFERQSQTGHICDLGLSPQQP